MSLPARDCDGMTARSGFYIAPMMGHTDYHYRWMMRQFTQHTVLFTEMITCRALLYGPTQRLLRHRPEHNPVVLQLAGSEPEDFARTAPLGEAAGFSEININAGCPSPRAGSGCFGAVLMRRPALLSELVLHTAEACNLPVSVKTRLGVDELDSDDYLADLLGQLAEAGCTKIYLHARKALLNGISPAQNRRVPPLDWERALRMRSLFANLPIVLNGGLDSLQKITNALENFAGAMTGRAAYDNPHLVAQVESQLAQNPGTAPHNTSPHRAGPMGEEPLQVLGEQIARHWGDKNAPQSEAQRRACHLMPFFRALPGSKTIRRRLAEASTDAERLGAELRSLPWQAVSERWQQLAALR